MYKGHRATRQTVTFFWFSLPDTDPLAPQRVFFYRIGKVDTEDKNFQNVIYITFVSAISAIMYSCIRRKSDSLPNLTSLLSFQQAFFLILIYGASPKKERRFWDKDTRNINGLEQVQPIHSNSTCSRRETKKIPRRKTPGLSSCLGWASGKRGKRKFTKN